MHKIIEECMIRKYRIGVFAVKARARSKLHHDLGEERLMGFKSFLSELGLTLEGGLSPSPVEYPQLMQQINEREDLVEIKAIAAALCKPSGAPNADNAGHFGFSS